MDKIALINYTMAKFIDEYDRKQIAKPNTHVEYIVADIMSYEATQNYITINFIIREIHHGDSYTPDLDQYNVSVSTQDIFDNNSYDKCQNVGVVIDEMIRKYNSIKEDELNG